MSGKIATMFDRERWVGVCTVWQRTLILSDDATSAAAAACIHQYQNCEINESTPGEPLKWNQKIDQPLSLQAFCSFASFSLHPIFSFTVLLSSHLPFYLKLKAPSTPLADAINGCNRLCFFRACKAICLLRFKRRWKSESVSECWTTALSILYIRKCIWHCRCVTSTIKQSTCRHRHIQTKCTQHAYKCV